MEDILQVDKGDMVHGRYGMREISHMEDMVQGRYRTVADMEHGRYGTW